MPTMNTDRDRAADNLAKDTPLSFREAWALMEKVHDDEHLARALITTGQAFNLSPWSVLHRMGEALS